MGLSEHGAKEFLSDSNMFVVYLEHMVSKPSSAVLSVYSRHQGLRYVYVTGLHKSTIRTLLACQAFEQCFVLLVSFVCHLQLCMVRAERVVNFSMFFLYVGHWQ